MNARERQEAESEVRGERVSGLIREEENTGGVQGMDFVFSSTIRIGWNKRNVG